MSLSDDLRSLKEALLRAANGAPILLGISLGGDIYLLYANIISAPPAEWLGPNYRMRLYSQRDPEWFNVEIAPGKTIGAVGCYLTCVAMVASVAGYSDTPPQVLAKLRDAGCFSGAELLYPQNIPNAYPNLRWDGVLDWRDVPADLERLRQELARGPVILEVEFQPGGPRPPVDQHFVVGLQFSQDGKGIIVADPWDGAIKVIPPAYAAPGWSAARAIYGARLIRPVSIQSAG